MNASELYHEQLHMMYAKRYKKTWNRCIGLIPDFAINQVVVQPSIECPCGIARVDCTYHKQP